MASSHLKVLLECPVCWDIYRNPVTLKCGHNVCCNCLYHILDTQEKSGAFSCPECREKFQERPSLRRNITLCKILEEIQSTDPDQEDFRVFCTYCIHTPVPAVISCLHCETSLCDHHLRLHSKSPEHVLCDPTTSLEKRKCSVHKELLEYYCTEDSVFICASCRLDENHQGHQVRTLDEAWNSLRIHPSRPHLQPTSAIQRSNRQAGGPHTGPIAQTSELLEATDILLDVSTAGDWIQILDDRKTVCLSFQERPETAERFQYNQVISSQHFFSGRHYWEVYVGESQRWIIGMCYPSIDRRGPQSVIGYNKKSWGLEGWRWVNNQYSVIHDSKETQLPINVSSNRVRIYLDYEAGRISFYDLCNPIQLLHTFNTTFTEPLHAGVFVCRGWIRISWGILIDKLSPWTGDTTGWRI